MKIKPLLESEAELTHVEDNASPIVLSTRVRLARNIADEVFPGWANPKQRSKVLNESFDALKDCDFIADPVLLKMDELSELEKQILIERHLISRELVGQESPYSGAIISKAQDLSIMVNEEDHLRIQLLRNGLKLKELWHQINNIDSQIETRLNYAFKKEWGYLTACPTNVGTGIRISAMMHLPGLVISGHMEKVVRMVNQVGIAVRGLFGEGTDTKGNIFQISNQQTLGEAEEEILNRLSNILSAIMEQENNARLKLLETNRETLLDRIGRAYGILKHTYVLNSEDAMNLLSILRLAVDMKMLPVEFRPIIDRAFIEIQPGHIQYHGTDNMSPEIRDIERATLIREQFKKIPPLNL